VGLVWNIGLHVWFLLDAGVFRRSYFTFLLLFRYFYLVLLLLYFGTPATTSAETKSLPFALSMPIDALSCLSLSMIDTCHVIDYMHTRSLARGAIQKNASTDQR